MDRRYEQNSSIPRSIKALCSDLPSLRPSLLVFGGLDGCWETLSSFNNITDLSVLCSLTNVNTNNHACILLAEDRRKDCKTEARYFIEFCIFCKVLALSPGRLAYKLAHNSYGQYCLTRITHTRLALAVYFLFYISN